MAGPAPAHFAGESERGLSDTTSGIRRNLKYGSAEAATASLPPPDSLTFIPMFDWPEQTQTSPVTISRETIVSLPAVMTRSPSGCDAMESRMTFHRPLPPAVVFLICPASLTVTRAPGVAQPQTGIGRPC